MILYPEGVRKPIEKFLKAYAFTFPSKEGEPGAGEAPDPLLKPPPLTPSPWQGLKPLIRKKLSD